MEEYKKNGMSENDKEIVFSQAIKAGKRIYYVDVKKNRREEMYISITESKKLVSGEGENASVSFEKHKIFLYREVPRDRGISCASRTKPMRFRPLPKPISCFRL